MVSRCLLRILARAALPAALLFLGSCGFFTASLFPGYLAQAEIGIDLSDEVDALLDGRTNPLRADLFVLRNNAGQDFACLLLFVDYSPDRTLFVLTPDGRLLQRGEPGLNWLHLTAADGNLVVGQAAYDPTNFAFVSDLSTLIWPEDAWKPAVPDGADNFVFDTNWSTVLDYYQYNISWIGRTHLSMILGASSYELMRVFHDPAVAGAEVILVLRASGGSGEAAVVVRTPQSGYLGASLVQPIVENYPHTLLSEDELDPRRTYYTRKGIAAASNKGLVTLYDFDGNKKGTLNLGQRKELRLAFNLEGTYFYCFNLEDRLLYKGKTGW
jgi:hypothetical protein